MAKAKKKAAPKRKPAAKAKRAAPKAKAVREVVKAGQLGSGFVEYDLPLTLGQLKDKCGASKLQATIDGVVEDNDNTQLEHGSYVTFTEKVKGN